VRIAPWPEDDGNPYQRLFYAALAPHGIERVSGLTINDAHVRGRRGQLDAVHFHWPEYIWRVGTESSWDRAKRVVGFLKFLRELKRLDIRIVWTFHNSKPHEAQWLDRIGFRALGRKSDLIITHSERVSADVRRRFRANVVTMPQGNYEGVYPEPRPRQVVLRELGLSPDLPTLVLVGVLRPYKGVTHAIDAVAHLQGRVQLVVAGNPKPGFDLAGLTARAQTAPWMRVVARSLSDQEFADIINAGTAVLLPYTRITTSAVLLVAWTFGRGAITSRADYFTDLLSSHPLAGRTAEADSPAILAAAIEDYLEIPEDVRWSEALKAGRSYRWSDCVIPVAEALLALPATNPRRPSRISVNEPAIVFEGVWKKFNRAQRFNSIRDLVPAMFSILTRGSDDDDHLHGKEFWALRDVSFQVGAGEALGIIGPNGAGKSTALKVLTRIMRPDRGTSIVRGRVGALVEIAAGFHPDLTGRENVFMQGAIMGMRRAEIVAKFDEIVGFAGVSEFIDTPIKRYSSGMNARLGFAVAAHLDPDVLIIDEVLSVGDLSFQEKCYERMKEFVRSGIAVAFVSHNLSAISMLCTRVLVLRHGRVETLAATHEAITSYAGLVQEARVAELGRHEVTLAFINSAGRPVSEVDAGSPVTVRVAAHPPASDEHFYAELQVRHLESGVLIYRSQSRALGVEPLTLTGSDGLEIVWSLEANFGRGHYGVSCAILNASHRWVAVSAPTLLTVNERQSEQSLVYLNASCEMRAIREASSLTQPA
jgi:ABC-type polysaccharide/polyol phosphate transport system ATPase subunit/glycosyltransferase involved in cell wall biosynthesis